MLMGWTAYHNSSRLRALALLIFAAVLALTGTKLYYTYQKTKQFDQAKAYYDAKQWIAAEDAFTRVRSNHWIGYKEAETAAALEALRPVTDAKRILAEVNSQIRSARGKDALSDLADAYGTYQEQKKRAAKNETDAAVFAELAASYGIEDKLRQAFADGKADLLKQMQAGIKKKAFEDEVITALLSIPAEYFGGDAKKKQEAAAELEKYDTARLDAYGAKKEFADVLKEGVRLLGVYSKSKFDAPWILSKLDQYAQNELAKLLPKDLPAFLANAKTYENTKELAVPGSKVLAYIRTSVNAQVQKADQLAASGKYAEAIDLYTKLGAYKDLAGSIQTAENKWAEKDPARLLEKAGFGKTFTQTAGGKDQWNAKLWAAGVQAGRYFFVRQLADGSLDKKQGSFNTKWSIRSLKVTDSLSLKSGQPALVLEAASSIRKARYLAFDLAADNALALLDLEADGYTVEKSGVLLADNPTGLPAGQKGYYEYQSGAYRFTKAKQAAITDIALSDLSRYKDAQDTPIRFVCQIVSVEGTTAACQSNGTYVVLNGAAATGGTGFRTGWATITGTYAGEGQVKLTGRTLPAYKVNVTAIAPAQEPTDGRTPGGTSTPASGTPSTGPGTGSGTGSASPGPAASNPTGSGSSGTNPSGPSAPPSSARPRT